jgi:hypothetical protein
VLDRRGGEARQLTGVKGKLSGYQWSERGTQSGRRMVRKSHTSAIMMPNVPTELIVYPGQFHGFTRPSFIRDRYQRNLDWYDKYLMGK